LDFINSACCMYHWIEVEVNLLFFENACNKLTHSFIEL
jgi:hypothetical protein